jgi:hypothetical protein
MLSVIVLFSALAGWLALVVGLPATASLLTRGWFGWLPAALLGAGLGAVFGQMVGNHTMFAFGHLYVLLRGQLGRAHPQAFCAPHSPELITNTSLPIAVATVHGWANPLGCSAEPMIVIGLVWLAHRRGSGLNSIRRSRQVIHG